MKHRYAGIWSIYLSRENFWNTRTHLSVLRFCKGWAGDSLGNA